MSQPEGDIATTCRWFAGQVFAGRSSLYEHLCLAMADDEALWDLIAAIPKGQPAPNMLFGAVHDRLLSGIDHPLAAYFPSLGGTRPVDGDAYAVFVDFCRQEAEAIRVIVTSRTVQTNEVGRSALWLPAMCRVASYTGEPLYLIECGTSAGLNLYWDRYGYDYGEGLTVGEAEAQVQLQCQRRGDRPLPNPKPFPTVAGRVGIDLHPIDVRDAAQVRWLRALLWPEQRRRAELLQAAVTIVQQDPPHMLAGDVFVHLPAAVAKAPAGTTPVVMHSFMANQLTEALRQELDARCERLGRQRPLHRLAIEWLGETHPTIRWTRYGQGEPQTTLLAEADQHGQWLHWLENGQAGGQ
jgi:hypothetical protein